MTDTSKDKIDIAMTATLRPKLLSDTLISIKDKICRGDEDRYTLIINVDPVGEKVDPKRIVKTARKNFKNVIYNIPEKPSFPKAVKWVWSEATAPFIFHIEDDWVINRKINVDDMISILNKNKKLSSLRLYKYSTPKNKIFTTFSCKWQYNEDGFYLARDWKKQFGLNPILIKKAFIDESLPKMRDNVNPEKQFRYSQEYMRDIIKKWQYGMYCKPGEKAIVSDIGRRWINKTKYGKPKQGTFLTWVTRN